jgi:hypothetical protein
MVFVVKRQPSSKDPVRQVSPPQGLERLDSDGTRLAGDKKEADRAVRLFGSTSGGLSGLDEVPLGFIRPRQFRDRRDAEAPSALQAGEILLVFIREQIAVAAGAGPQDDPGVT